MPSKIIGIDLGSKTMGVAISDSFGIIATGLEVFEFPPDHYKLALDHLVTLINKHDVSTVVIGHPKNMDNTESRFSKVCIRFKNRLINMTKARVILVDERLTTKLASYSLDKQNVHKSKQKNYVDKIAATIILQDYLDSIKGENNGR